MCARRPPLWSAATMNAEAVEQGADLDFYREEARSLRVQCARLTAELRLARRVLGHLLPPAGTEALPEVSAAVRLPNAEFAAGESDLRFSVDDVRRGPIRTHLRGWALAPGLDCATARVLLVFASPGALYAIPTEPDTRLDVGAAFATTGLAANPERAGFLGAVFNPSLPPGEYDLFLHVEQPGVGAARRPTGVRVTF